jgi:hypothetical protein
MRYAPDQVELEIQSTDQALNLLASFLPDFNELFSLWEQWFEDQIGSCPLYPIVSDALLISYARMALRNGSLSPKSRNYHNEGHIDDLLYRLMAVSEYPKIKQRIPKYGWSILSLFMGAHDLRQNIKESNDDLVGNNEKASFDEVKRLIERLDHKKVFQKEHIALLKLMIYGSTFGKSEDQHGNVFNGNLVKYLLDDNRHFEPIEKEIAYLACDIDTANVSAPLLKYAEASIDVYNEIQNFSATPLDAKLFFGDLQENYFFTLQRYNSKIGRLVFDKFKLKNAPIIRKISNSISNLSDNLTNEEVVELYLELIQDNL